MTVYGTDPEKLEQALTDAGYDEWEVVDDTTLCSPNGHCIEYDGTSPDGEVSPLVQLGWI